MVSAYTRSAAARTIGAAPVPACQPGAVAIGIRHKKSPAEAGQSHDYESRNYAADKRVAGEAAALPLRRIEKPMAPKPISIMAHVPGSGRAEVWVSWKLP